MPGPLPIASFKLSFVERRVRVMPKLDDLGHPFAGPGVDLVGDEAEEPLALAAPLLAWLRAREEVRVRALSFDVGRRRLLVTLEAEPRPRVLKIDPGVDAGSADDLLALAGALLVHLGERSRIKLAGRRAREHGLDLRALRGAPAVPGSPSAQPPGFPRKPGA